MFAALGTAARTLLGRWRLRRCTTVGAGVRVRGRVWVHGGGEIHVGARVTFDGARTPIELHVARGARLSIGDDAAVGPGTSIEATESVTIGPRARLLEFCKVLDNHFHRMHGQRSARPMSAPVVVEADVELGVRCILLPGARVGRGATVAAASVVTRPVPAGAFASGVPALVRPR